MKRVRAWTSVAVSAAMLLTSCGQGGGGGSGGSGSGGSNGAFYQVPPQESLSVAEVGNRRE